MAYCTTLLNLAYVLITIALEMGTSDGSSSYEDIGTLSSETIHSPRNKRDLRPLRNQSDVLFVSVSFSLVSVVEVDDLAQKFVVNGFLNMKWHNEILGWNASDYGGIEALVTDAHYLWRPRLMLVNTVGNMDPFSDQPGSTFLSHVGTSMWVPGGVFSTSCQLNLEKYPFDEQECHLQFCTMGDFVSSLEFVISNSEIDRTFFIPNRGWDLVSATGFVDQVELASRLGNFSCPTFKFKIDRRPTFFVLYVIVPVILLSFLNALVFAIPADSGEKISYGITVLLALYVFISTISTLLPQASDTVPVVTIYLFSLLACSVLSVVVSIATVILHEKKETIESEEQEEMRPQVISITSEETDSIPFRHRRSLNCITEGASNSTPNGGILNSESSERVHSRLKSRRFWVWANKYANSVSLVVFTLTLLVSTICFFSYVIH